jgi:hypothetical protein
MAVKRMSAAEAAAYQEQEAGDRAKAARQAAKLAVEPQPDAMVTVRVLPKGADKISTGRHYPGIGEIHYEKGETFPIAATTAKELEDRGFVEIVTGG